MFPDSSNSYQQGFTKGIYSFHFLSNIDRRKWKVTGQVVIKALMPGQENPGFCLYVRDIKLPATTAATSEHIRCCRLVSLKRGEEEEKPLASLTSFVEAVFLRKKSPWSMTEAL